MFTQDGRVAKHLIGRDSAVEKEYLVRIEGTLSDAGMKLLQQGLELDGVRLKPARVSWQNEHQLRFVLREGRKRQIRRMCELVGLVVTGLKRVRSGSVPLGRIAGGAVALPPARREVLKPAATLPSTRRASANVGRGARGHLAPTDFTGART